jgi:hypothetical protein
MDSGQPLDPNGDEGRSDRATPDRRRGILAMAGAASL